METPFLRRPWHRPWCALLVGLGAACTSPRAPQRETTPLLTLPDARVDWHTHLSLEAAGTLDSLRAHGVQVVRDCGGDLDSLLGWRDRIARGTMRGPRLVVAGPLLDGPKPGAPFRFTVPDVATVEAAVDSLARAGVDFLKVHNAVPPATFYALLARARRRQLPVAVHLPRGVPAWTAVDSGASSIEHAAESLVASPLYAGVATTPDGALTWWRSPAGDSVMARWARVGVVVVPTLARYEATIASAADSLRAARGALLPGLLDLVGRLHRRGVRIAAGTDMAGVAGAPPVWAALRRELELLRDAGLDAAALRDATSPAVLDAWLAAGRRGGR